MGKFKYDNSKSYDDNLFYYIWEIENPDSIGYDSKTDRWIRPTLKGYDKNQIGIGLDTVTNNEVRNFLKNNKRNYLTTPEVRKFMNNSINYFNGALNRIINNQKISNTKRMAAIGLLYRGDSPSLRKNKNGMLDALLKGSDRDFIDAITAFHNSGGRTERAARHSGFFEDYNEATPQANTSNAKLLPKSKNIFTALNEYFSNFNQKLKNKFFNSFLFNSNTSNSKPTSFFDIFKSIK